MTTDDTATQGEWRVVACCTLDGILHLFGTREDFLAFTAAHASSTGLVMAWIDGVKIH